MPTPILAFLSLLVTAACGIETEETADSGRDADDARQVSLEASDGPTSDIAREYSSPEGFALPFTSEIPAGTDVTARLEDGPDAIEFTWNLGPQRGDSAGMYLVVLGAGESEDRAREIVRTAAEQVRVPGASVVEPLDRRQWAVIEYRINSRGTLDAPMFGWAALGHEQGRWFYFIVQGGPDAWPHLEPRIDRILDSWRWTTTGSGLRPTQ